MTSKVSACRQMRPQTKIHPCKALATWQARHPPLMWHRVLYK